MNSFGILSNRKRAIIALVHTVFFLLVAFVQMLLAHPVAAFTLHGHNDTSTLVLVTIYSIVTTVLLILFGYSRGFVERLYFACCTTSAVFGLLRSLVGDPPLHIASYVRVVMLACAVLIGSFIVRIHSVALLPE